MINGIISLLVGTKHDRDVKRLKPVVQKINSLEQGFREMNDDELKAMTSVFKQRLAKSETLEDILPEAFAVVREASIRTLGMRHFDVQLMGGIVLHQGRIAEMKTGEGKTLVATLPVYLNALEGKGAHVVTVNDYLARRDSEWMGTIYKFLGLSVGVILHNMNHHARQEAYACDITYGTNNEFGFDYLRDNMVEHRSLRVQRSRNFCIVDEVDSILIDEARTPLIISGSTEESTKKYYLINKIIPSLKDGEDYEVNEKDRNVVLTEDGVRHVERLLKIDNLYDNQNIEIIHHINQALKAHTLFQKDVDYTVKEGQVVIVDEFTGRLMPGRRYSDGLHQALEAKENVTIARESQTLASITFQNFFRMYNKLSGMTGTADTEAIEFKKIYELDVVVVPPNRLVQRNDYSDRIYRTEKEKYKAIVDEIVELSEKGQPVLVGTISIEKSEKISAYLKSRGIIHNVLNAKYHEKEAEIIAEAGKAGKVTIATNMAGRGTDIVLGGKKDFMEELESHEPVHSPEKWAQYKNLMLTSNFDKAETLAEELEGQDRARARQIVKSGREWTENHELVVKAGGLHILGTERHESRRIDNQLRGRSGRQGDPGSSRFYLSLDDELMRLFASERISNIMQRLGMQEGQEIESKMVSKAIANAQKRVEGRNFEIRKHLLEYDDVMNAQRNYIYNERNDLLEGEDVSGRINDYITEIVNNALLNFTGGARHPEEWDIPGMKVWFKNKLLVDFDETGIIPDELSADELAKKASEAIKDVFKQKESHFGSRDMRALERILSLQVIDNKWRQHLLNMDQLRDGIWTLGYGEKNPLVEYKLEGFRMFKELLISIKEDILEYLAKVQIQRREEQLREDYIPVGEEFHPEASSFTGGDIFDGVTANNPSSAAKKKKDQAPTTGGVKRKKSRRNRR